MPPVPFNIEEEDRIFSTHSPIPAIWEWWHHKMNNKAIIKNARDILTLAIPFIWNTSILEGHQLLHRDHYKPIKPTPIVIIFRILKGPRPTNNNSDKANPKDFETYRLRRCRREKSTPTGPAKYRKHVTNLQIFGPTWHKHMSKCRKNLRSWNQEEVET